MPTNTYKIIDIHGDPASTPDLSIVNKSGSAYASHTGTPTKRGVWRVTIQADGTNRYAHVLEVEQANGSIRPQVFASGSYQLVPGVTITLGGTLNDGDIFDVAYSMYVPDIA